VNPSTAQACDFIGGIVGIVPFPSCWDGQNPPGDDTSHVVYPVAQDNCPVGYEHRLPRLSERTHFGIMDPCAGARPCEANVGDENVVFILASGAYFTMHADFWNTWDQASLDNLVDGCLQPGMSCGNIRNDGDIPPP
jgi:hypothetical protein